jgi:2-dehydropantoate 2-reductase
MSDALGRYLVVGAGGVGVAVAVALHDARRPVVLVARGPALDRIRNHGVRYSRPTGTRTVRLDTVAGPGEVTLRRGDVLVLATKAQHVAGILADWAWRPVFDGDTEIGTATDHLTVVTLQNGLESERLAARWFDRVIGGTTLVAARHLTPGEVHVANTPRTGQILLGAYPSARQRPDLVAGVSAVSDDLRAGGWLSQPVRAVGRWKAWKLLANIGNAVQVLAGECDVIDDLQQGVLAEARAALSAAGYTFAEPADELEYNPAHAAISIGGSFVPGQFSTWQSFARGSSSEVDYLNGEIVLLGRLHGVPTPLNAAVQKLLGRAAAAKEPPGVRSAAEVFELAGDPRATIRPAYVRQTAIGA